MNQAALDEINKKLKSVFGITQDGRANWRLIWSETEDATEIRRGVFNRFSDKEFENFKRADVGMFREKKYPWVKERYLLEQLVYQPHSDVPETNKGHYELRYTTQDGAGNYLPPKWEVYEAIVYFFVSGKAQIKMDWKAYFERESKQYKEWAKNVMEENFPLISHQRLAGEASFVPSTYGDKAPNVLKKGN